VLIISGVVEKIFVVNSKSIFRITANLKISNNIFQELVTNVLPSLLRLEMSTKLILGVEVWAPYRVTVSNVYFNSNEVI